MSKILVTGGAGFIGGHLVDFLVKKNYQVLVIDNFTNGNYKNTGAKYVNKDFRKLTPKLLEDVDTVFHLAGILDVETSKTNPFKYIEENSTATYKLLELCVKSKIRKFIYASSCASAFPHSSPYALSKYLPELYCKTYSETFDIDTTALRFFNVYGERMNHSGYKLVLSIFLDQYKNNLPLTVTNDGKQKRDFVHVNDVISALYKSKNINTGTDVFDVGSGTTHSILELVDMFKSEYKFIGERKEEEIAFSNIKNTQKVLKWEPKHSLGEFIECVKN